MKELLFVLSGGALGSILRYTKGELFSYAGGLPIETFCFNVAGSFLMGILSTRLTKKYGIDGPIYKFLMLAGYIGGYTIFSALSKEGYIQIQQDQWGLWLAYLLLNIFTSMGCMSLGTYVSRDRTLPRTSF